MKFDLITTYYKASEPEREIENLYCLSENVKNPLINNIYLFLQGHDKPEIINNDKIKYINHHKRPLFIELFHFANSLQSDTLKIVSNSDIYFDSSLELVPRALKKWDVLALTRYDLNDKGEYNFFRNFKSQDCWIFNKKIKSGIGNYFIGQYGCDNRLIYEFVQNNYKIANPSFSIYSYHVHLSNLRSYFQDPNYKYVLPPYGYLLPIYFRWKFNCLLNINYVSLRYSYFTSIGNNNLMSYQSNILIRLLGKLRSKFYAYLLNKLN